MNQQSNIENAHYQRKKETRGPNMTLWQLSDDIVEVEVDEGANASGRHIRHLVSWAEGLSPPPRALLINRKNDYSLELSVFLESGKQKIFKYVAMANHGKGTQYIVAAFWPRFLKHSIFNTREDALNWLIKRIDKDSLTV